MPFSPASAQTIHSQFDVFAYTIVYLTTKKSTYSNQNIFQKWDYLYFSKWNCLITRLSKLFYRLFTIKKFVRSMNGFLKLTFACHLALLIGRIWFQGVSISFRPTTQLVKLINQDHMRTRNLISWRERRHFWERSFSISSSVRLSLHGQFLRWLILFTMTRLF